MKEARLPWSWLAVAMSLPVAGVVLMPLMLFTDSLRHGLDADMVHHWFNLSVADAFVASLSVGAVSLPFLAAAFWLVRLMRLRSVWFVLIAASLPAGIALAINLYFVVLGWFEPTVGVIPFESSNFTYLPNWLGPASIAIAVGSAALFYVSLAKTFHGNKALR